MRRVGEYALRKDTEAEEQPGGIRLRPSSRGKKYLSMESGSARARTAEEDMTQFVMACRSLAFLMKDGYSPAVAADLLSRQTSGAMGEAVARAVKLIKSGQPMATAFRNTGFFPENFCDVLGVGEKNGRVAEAMESYILYLENVATMKDSLRSALKYPSFMLSFLSVMSVFLLLFVTPRLVLMAEALGVKPGDLPFYSRWLFLAYDVLTTFTIWPVVGVAALFAWYMFLGPGKEHIIRFLAFLPQIQSIYYRLQWTQWLLLGSTCTKSGMLVTDMLRSVRRDPPPELSGKGEYDRVIRNVNGGKSLSEELQRMDAPSHIHQTIGLAEHSGRVGEAMESLARQFLHGLTYDTKNVGVIVSPVMIAFTTLIGGGLAGLFILTVLAISGNAGG